ncbi:hypothetical protein SNEBB_000671 [Seison nebaliae]|nr:hypothetical protein SNEBB_000671 [Seison nebaliae]
MKRFIVKFANDHTLGNRTSFGIYSINDLTLINNQSEAIYVENNVSFRGSIVGIGNNLKILENKIELLIKNENAELKTPLKRKRTPKVGRPKKNRKESYGGLNIHDRKNNQCKSINDQRMLRNTSILSYGSPKHSSGRIPNTSCKQGY